MPPKPRRPKLVDRRRQRTTNDSEDNVEGSKKGDVFHFVSVNPSSETQKSENRSVIRSHASKYIWRQHRAVRADGTTTLKPTPTSRSASGVAADASVEPSEISPTGESSAQAGMTMVPYNQYSSDGRDCETMPLQPSSGEATVYAAPSLPPAPGYQSYDEQAVSSEDKDPENPEHASGSTSDSRTYVPPEETLAVTYRNAMGTPFTQLRKFIGDSRFRDELGDSSTLKLLQYAAFDLWPFLILGSGDQEWNQAAARDAWLPRAFQNEALFTAFMYGAAGHMQTRKRLEGAAPYPQTIEERNEQIMCEVSTVKRLNKVFTDPVESLTDEAILATLCMAFNRTDWKSWSASDPFPKPPLRNLQWLDVYGGLSLNNSHVRGLLKLLEMKGGVFQVKLPGLAETLSVAAIMLSTKSLTSSPLPFVPVYKGTAKGQTPGWPSLNDSVGVGMGVVMSNGGPDDPVSKAGLPEGLVQSFRDMRDYNTVINLYSQGLLKSLSLATIADRRNYVQYHLLQHKPAGRYPSRDFTEANMTYEPCRLGALIYSVLVIFPLPATNRPFMRLAGYLKVALLDAGTTTNWVGATDMLLWVLVMGCIAARGISYEDWFYEQLCSAIVGANLTEWYQLKHILSSVIWLDSTCDMRGVAIWDEMNKRFTPEQVAHLFSEPAFGEPNLPEADFAEPVFPESAGIVC